MCLPIWIGTGPRDSASWIFWARLKSRIPRASTRFGVPKIRDVSPSPGSNLQTTDRPVTLFRRLQFLSGLLAAVLLVFGSAEAARIDWFLQPLWERATRFSEGLAAVRSGGLWGFIDPGGRWVLPPAFADARPFRGGAAAVSIQGRWGFIDRKGKVLVPLAFEAAGSFNEGLALTVYTN